MSPDEMDRAEITDVLNNPYIGWAPWADGGPYPQPHRLVYGQLLWSELEPTKYNYNWIAIETKLKFSYWTGRNVKLILRVIMDLPGSSSHKDIPEWLYSEINREGTWYNRGFSPNYKNQVLVSNHERLITALSQRYNNDPRIAFIEIGSLGHWAEFHTVYISSGAQGYMPPISISDRYVQHYINGFTQKQLLMRRPFQIAKDNGLGLFNDMFGNASETPRFLRYVNSGYTNPGNYGVAAGSYPAMPDFWKYGPSGGEIGDCPGLQYLSDSAIRQTIQYAIDSHTSWLGPCCPVSQAVGSSLQKNIDSLLNKMGYRFVLDTKSHAASINSGSTLSVTMQWSNKGVAPFYYKWPLELSLSDSSGNIVIKVTTTEDIRTWLPGTRTITHPISIPRNLLAGTYTLCAAILDPETNLPGIYFAMTGRRTDGRYSIGVLEILSPTPPIPPVISNITASSITSNSAIISWKTDKASDSQVEYGTSVFSTSSELVPDLVTSHSISLTGLLPSTLYFYRVKSRDIQGNLAVSSMNSFDTPSDPVTPPDIIIDGDLTDWDDITAVAVARSADLMKVTNDTENLYICVQGKGMDIKSSIYINTDTNSNTGYKVPGWNTTGCDYLLENNRFYKYSGDGSTWSWNQIRVLDFERNNTALEVSIPMFLMNLASESTIFLGYVMNDSMTIRLPTSGEPLASYSSK